MKRNSFLCPQCRQMRLFEQEGINHILHLLITIFLCGLWIPVWILMAFSAENNPYRCTFCGYGDYYKYLANPNLRATEQRNAQIAAQKRASEDNSHFYKIGAIVLGGVIFVCAVILISNWTNSEVTTVTQPVKDARYNALESRRLFATEVQNRYFEKVAVFVTASGNDNEILTITSPKIDQKYANKFSNDKIVSEIKAKGFVKIILDNQKNKWEIKF